MEIKHVKPEKYHQMISALRRITNVPLRLSFTDIEHRCSLPCRIVYFCELHPPTVSYGCILMSAETNRFLCAKRRFSVDFIEFLLGNYSRPYLPVILLGIPEGERDKLITDEFNSLWLDVFGTPPDATNRSIASFEKNISIARDLLDEFPPNPLCEMNMWIFPKGKPDYSEEGEREDSISCALREFGEESRGIDLNGCRFLSSTFQEEFSGLNSKRYKVKYMIAKTDIETCGRGYSGEIQETQWKSRDDICSNMIPRKGELITRVSSMLPPDPD